MFDNLPIFFTIISGIWVLWNYFFKRSFAPKIKIKLSGDIFDKDSSNQNILIATLQIQNIGEVRLKSNKIKLSVRGINKHTKLKIGDEKILHQIIFKEKIYEENLVPKEWEYTFIDPGVTQDYQYVILIPKDFKYLLLESKIYFNKKDFQLTSNIIKIKDEP